MLITPSDQKQEFYWLSSSTNQELWLRAWLLLRGGPGCPSWAVDLKPGVSCFLWAILGLGQEEAELPSPPRPPLYPQPHHLAPQWKRAFCLGQPLVDSGLRGD